MDITSGHSKVQIQSFELRDSESFLLRTFKSEASIQNHLDSRNGHWNVLIVIFAMPLARPASNVCAHGSKSTRPNAFRPIILVQSDPAQIASLCPCDNEHQTVPPY